MLPSQHSLASPVRVEEALTKRPACAKSHNGHWKACWLASLPAIESIRRNGLQYALKSLTVATRECVYCISVPPTAEASKKIHAYSKAQLTSLPSQAPIQTVANKQATQYSAQLNLTPLELTFTLNFPSIFHNNHHQPRHYHHQLFLYTLLHSTAQVHL